MSIQKQIVEQFVNTWRWDFHEENLVRKWIIGNSLHVCCGLSKIGDIKVDIEPNVKPDILCSVYDLQNNRDYYEALKQMGISKPDTVISDPPWNLAFTPKYWKALKRLAAKRIIVIALAQMMEGRDWHKTHEEIIKRQNGFQVKVMTVYDRQSHNLEMFN